MTVLSQSTYTLKRVAKEGYSASLTPETIALPANSAGEVQDYSTAKAKLRLTYNGKEIYPVFDSSLSKEIDGGSATIGTLTTLNCIASINAGGEVSITNLTSNAGYVDIPISYGQFSTVKRLTVAKSKQGRSIVSSSYEYAQSTSATTAPETGWVTTPPAWIDGRYIWVRTKITYSEGSPVTTDPINLTGAGGSAGTGIDSITTEFYLSTSKTTQTGGSWSETRPAWVNGKYLWTRLKIVYKNPASTVNTTPVVSSEWEAVNDLRTELVLDYTSKLDVLEDAIEANVTETTSVKDSVTGLKTRVSEAEASLTIQSGQISSKVAQTEYDSNNTVINQQMSLIEQKANQIDVKVGKMRTGAKNLLRNFDFRIPDMKYWSAGAEIVTESGSPVQQLTVLSITPIPTVTVQRGSVVYPPSYITLNISDGTTRTAYVSWGAYSSSVVGSFTVSGDYTLPQGITGSKPSVSFTLVVTSESLTITGVTQPNAVSVAQGGTPILPTSVVLTISDGSIRTVAVTWSNYSTTTPGTFSLIGTYSLPSGITGSKPAVTLNLTVAAVITILSVVAPSNATVEVGTSYTPPSTIVINLSTGSTQTVPVSWSSYDVNTAGDYTLIGSYDMPEGVTGSKPSVSFVLTVSATPIVLTIISVAQPSAITSDIGDNISLPSTIVLNISDGSTRTVPVTWGAYSTENAGDYTIIGSYNLPSGVTGDKPSVSISLTVVAPLSIVGYLVRPANFTVNEGYSLAQWMNDYDFIDFVLSDGTTRRISVTWDTNYNVNSPAGTYYINAVYTLPIDIFGDTYPVIVTLTVLEAEYIDIVPYLIDEGFSTGTDENGSYVLVTGSTLDLKLAVGSFLDTETAEYKLFIKAASVTTSTSIYYRLTDLTYGVISIKSVLTIEAAVVNTGNVHLDQFTLQPGNKQVKIYGFEIRRSSSPPSWYI